VVVAPGVPSLAVAGGGARLKPMNTIAITRETNSSRRAYRHEWDGIIVDTVERLTTGRWETAVNCEAGRPSAWHVVDLYGDESDAKDGHGRWVRSMIDDPTQELPDYSAWR
jgi:hypothetical protein